MKQNKSIDGLVTKDAKSEASVQAAHKQPKKHIRPSKVNSVKQSNLNLQDSETFDETINISINNSAESAPTAKPTQSVDDFLSPVQAFDFDSDSDSLTPSSAPSDTPDSTTPSSSAQPKSDNTSSTKSVKSTESTVSPKSSKPTKTKKPHSKTRRILTIILLVIVLGVIGFVVWALVWGNGIIGRITGGQGNIFDLVTFVDDKYEPLKTDANGRTNILAIGTSGYNMAGDEGDGIHDGAALTDSIMMISLNQETGDIAMLSLPRDLKASPTCTATGKINEVYWCNNMYDQDEAAGATALMEEVGSILGVDFQYYAHLNWGSVVYIVDALDGINVTLDENIEDYYYTEAVYEAGKEYTINGEQALGLARARHGTIGGDFSRGASQQKILVGIKNKVFEKDLSITDLLGLASNLGDNLRTNFTVAELKTLAHMTWLFDFDSMRTLSLYPDFMTTGMINGISYVLPAAGVGNYADIQEFVATNLSNDPRVYEIPTILVLNATDTAGLAGTERDKLIAAGYANITTDNAPAGEYPTGYTLYAITSKPGTKKLLEKEYGLEALPADSLPADISTDYDFVLIVNPATTQTTNNN